MVEGLADVDPVVEPLAELEPPIDVSPVNDDVPTAPIAEKAADDLTKLVGIGPKLAVSLAGLGVNDLTDDPVRLQATLATLLKTQSDRGQVPTEVAQRLAGKAA